ncbi:hypothetical protein VP01_3890g1 [Puccinia sorghi]|uniref:Uncharacterized protein n=1 Tax=Puccinia sorghi TaxID=27349 RepID=A0A0L6USW4_9BASI|nr:hypothetical protein VP01_3890g1 [Puccinia sorghi]
MASNLFITLAWILVEKMNVPPPDGKFQDPEDMVEKIKRVFQNNGYAICIRRSEKDKKKIFKCDQCGVPFELQCQRHIAQVLG